MDTDGFWVYRIPRERQTVVCMKKTRCDTNEGRETKVTVTSKLPYRDAT